MKKKKITHFKKKGKKKNQYTSKYFSKQHYKNVKLLHYGT